MPSYKQFFVVLAIFSLVMAFAFAAEEAVAHGIRVGRAVKGATRKPARSGVSVNVKVVKAWQGGSTISINVVNSSARKICGAKLRMTKHPTTNIAGLWNLETTDNVIFITPNWADLSAGKTFSAGGNIGDPAGRTSGKPPKFSLVSTIPC